MFRSETRGKGHIFIFDNISQLVKFNKESERNYYAFGGRFYSDKSTELDDDFYGDITSYADAENLLVNGWEDGFKKAIKELGKIQIENPNPERKIETEIGVEGFAPCVPRLLEGHPETMHNHKIIKIHKKIVTIIVQTGNLSDITASQTLRRGMIVTNYIHGLEKLGYRVNLYGGACAREVYEYCISLYKLKDSKENISIKRLVFPLAHPSMHRRINFRTRECMTDNSDNWSYYGSTDDHTFKGFLGEKFENAMFIPSMRTIYCGDSTSPKEYMKEVYEYNKNFRLR